MTAISSIATQNFDALRRDNANNAILINPTGQDDSVSGSSNSVRALEASAQSQGQNDNSDENPSGLTQEEEAQVRRLQQRDAEVRAHEQAHAAVGGQYAGAPSYDFQTGPDGRQYAVGGSVPIDVSAESTPRETILKAQIVQRAALAPAQPSQQDYRVAAEAAQLEIQARLELNRENAEESEESRDDPRVSIFQQISGFSSENQQEDADLLSIFA